MDSFMPVTRGPQAVVCASRVASASEAAEAVAVFRVFLNATVTVHCTRWDERVDHSRKPPKARITSSVRTFPRLFKKCVSDEIGVWFPAEEPGTGYRCSATECGWKGAYARGKRLMECEAVRLLLWEYLDEELRPEVATAVAAHLGRCACCHPVYCRNRAFLQLLGRQRDRCSAPTTLRLAVRARLPLS